MTEPWPSAGIADLALDAAGRLQPQAGWWRRQFARPELALVAESCAAERALAAALAEDPLRPVGEADLAALADADARDNWRTVLRWRERVQAAGSLEAAYVEATTRGRADLPPPFVATMAQAILRHLLDASDDALEWRAAEMLFREQRCASLDGRLVAGDRETLDARADGADLGALGRLLAEAGAPLARGSLELLTPERGPEYFASAERHRFALDLTAEVGRELGDGIRLAMTNAQSAQRALARVLERWVRHFSGAAVRIAPLARIEAERWRWHVGLDAGATALLNALWAGEEPAADALARIVALFRLEFENPAEARPELDGAPVWLAATQDAHGLLRLKPQNLLANLPLARPC